MRRLKTESRTRRSGPRGARRRSQRRWRRAGRPLAIAATVLAAGFATWWWARATDLAGRIEIAFETGYRQFSAAAGLVVEEVLVEGRRETPRDAILSALRIRRGDPILALDPAAIRERLLGIGWIADARVERRLPDTLFLRIRERRPIAIWQRKGRFFLVGRDGVTITSRGIERYPRLKVIVGEDAPKYAAALLAMLSSEPDLMDRVVAAVRVGGRRWNLRLDNGIDVHLPEENAAEAWRRLARYEREHRLLQREIVAVDLRMPDRLIVRMARQRTARRAPPGERN